MSNQFGLVVPMSRDAARRAEHEQSRKALTPRDASERLAPYTDAPTWSQGARTFQGLAPDIHADAKRAARATLRALYREGKLTVAQALAAGVKPSDHGHAVASGKVDIGTLIAHGVDVHAANVAYNRATGNGAVSKARKASPSASSVEAQLLAGDNSDAMRRVVAARKAKRHADKLASAGKVYTQAEIAALMATLAR